MIGVIYLESISAPLQTILHPPGARPLRDTKTLSAGEYDLRTATVCLQTTISQVKSPCRCTSWGGRPLLFSRPATPPQEPVRYSCLETQILWIQSKSHCRPCDTFFVLPHTVHSRSLFVRFIVGFVRSFVHREFKIQGRLAVTREAPTNQRWTE